jgi:hypothetical protein
MKITPRKQAGLKIIAVNTVTGSSQELKAQASSDETWVQLEKLLREPGS